ncbi:MAG: hypothetical protein ABL986_12890 [Vicinamibacterales bacterium]
MPGSSCDAEEDPVRSDDRLGILGASPGLVGGQQRRRAARGRDAPDSFVVGEEFSGERSGNYTNVVSINGVQNTSMDSDWKPAGTATGAPR